MKDEPEAARTASAGAGAVDHRSDTVRVRAREAAEALFKPKPSAPHVPVSSAPEAAGTPEPPPQQQRKPRIIAIPPPPPRAPSPPPRDTAPARHAAKPSASGKIDEADYGRIRALATHGLTLVQVAELYDVPLQTIERIVGETEDGQG